MFDVGFWELLIIAGLGLLILGPERLPRVVGQLGRWLRQARRTASQLRWQIEHELDLSERREAERKREQTKKPAANDDKSATTGEPASQGHHGGPASDADEPLTPADAAPEPAAESAFPEDPAAPAGAAASGAGAKTQAAKPAANQDAPAADQRNDASRSA